MRDPQLIDAIARFIAEYREAGHPPSRMQENVLGVFPQANSSDFAIALTEANRRQRPDIGG